MATEISYEVVLLAPNGSVSDILDGEFNNISTCRAIIKDRYTGWEYTEEGYSVAIRQITREVI